MTPTLNKRLSISGFTLLEVVVAMGLIAIALVTIIQLHSHNLTLQTETQLISTVNFLASARLAEVQAESDLQPGSVTGDFGEDYPVYHYKQDVESVVDFDDLYKVTLTIYTDEQDTGREFTFDTYLYRKKQ